MNTKEQASSRLANVNRDDLDVVRSLPVMLPEGGAGVGTSVPLSELVSFRTSEGLNQVSRENGQRSVVVQANVRGRDLGSYVDEAQERVAQVQLPPGVTITSGGQFETLQAASQRIALIVPIVFLLIFGILILAVRNLRWSLAVYSAVPLGLAGGAFALVLADLPFSISAAVGFIVLSGVTVLNGLVVMTSVRQRIDAGRPVDEAIIEGTMERVRAVLMTGIVPAVGFVPMAIATGRGAEVQKPLAIVVIGGLIVATVMTLYVLPAISHLILRRRGEAHEPGDFEDDGASVAPLPA